MTHHPRPEMPESKVEHQADQPGVTTDAKAQKKADGKQGNAKQSH